MSATASDDLALDEVKQGLENGVFVLVDVREEHEFAMGHIPGAVLMPMSRFDPDELPREEGKRLVFSCQTGRRSLAALRQAREAGRNDVAGHFAAGFAGWRAAGEDIAFD